MKCDFCGKNFPSHYYFKTAHCCTACFAKLDEEAQQRLVHTEAPPSPHESAQSWTINGHALICPVCANGEFWKRKTLMNTPGLTFLGMEWANRQAVNYVCSQCGYVFWFLLEA